MRTGLKVDIIGKWPALVGGPYSPWPTGEWSDGGRVHYGRAFTARQTVDTTVPKDGGDDERGRFNWGSKAGKGVWGQGRY